MKPFTSLYCVVAGLVWLATMTPAVRAQFASQSAEPIPLSELGAKDGGCELLPVAPKTLPSGQELPSDRVDTAETPKETTSNL
jgi:hypothetical protein